MSRRRQQMLDLIRRQSNDVVLEYSLRQSLIKEGFVVEFLNGEACMQSGCDLCVVAACPTCGRVGKSGEVVFLVDHKPFVRLGVQSMEALAKENSRF